MKMYDRRPDKVDDGNCIIQMILSSFIRPIDHLRNIFKYPNSTHKLKQFFVSKKYNFEFNIYVPRSLKCRCRLIFGNGSGALHGHYTNPTTLKIKY